MSEFLPPLTRVLSSRPSTKVSCETLIFSNDDRKLPHSVYFSDDDDGEVDADGSSGRWRHLQHDFECASPTSRCESFENASHYHAGYLESPSYHQYGTLQNSGYGHGSLKIPHDEKPSPAIGRQRRILARLFSKVLQRRHSMPGASRPSGRNRKFLRKFLSATSGGLVPHSGPIMLPIGSHSGPLNVNSKAAPVLVKASSIIPSNAVSGKMSALGMKDPSSPKVTCLGRVRMEQQSRQNAAKVSPAVADDGNRHERLFACLVPKLKRKEEKADVEAFASAYTSQRRREKLDASGHTPDWNRRTGSGRKNTSNDREKAKLATKKLKGKLATPALRCITKEESKGLSQVKIVNPDVTNSCHQYEEAWPTQIPASAASSPEADVCLNLSRFGCVDSQQQLESSAANSSVIDSRSKRFESKAGQASVGGQTPPVNALMLMRNGKPRDDEALQWYGGSDHIVQAPPQNALLMMKNSKPKGNHMEGSMCISSSGVLGATETSKIVSKQLQPGGDKSSSPCGLEFGTEMKELNSSSRRLEPFSDMASNSDRLQDRFSSQREASAIQRHASFPNREVTNLWQRRGAPKLSGLEIGRPN